MIIASVVCEMNGNVQENIRLIEEYTKQAKANNAEYVLFSLNCLGGGVCGQNISMERKIVRSLKSQDLEKLGQIASQNKVALGVGFLEEKEQGFYNSYILFEKNGKCKDVYRQCSPSWHIDEKGHIYTEGESISAWVIDDLCFSVLLGSDIDDEILCAMVNALEVDICLLPSCISETTMSKNLEKIKKATKALNTNVLLINQYVNKASENIYCGGVYEISDKGVIENSFAFKTSGIHYTQI